MEIHDGKAKDPKKMGWSRPSQVTSRQPTSTGTTGKRTPKYMGRAILLTHMAIAAMDRKMRFSGFLTTRVSFCQKTSNFAVMRNGCVHITFRKSQVMNIVVSETSSESWAHDSTCASAVRTMETPTEMDDMGCPHVRKPPYILVDGFNPSEK